MFLPPILKRWYFFCLSIQNTNLIYAIGCKIAYEATCFLKSISSWSPLTISKLLFLQSLPHKSSFNNSQKASLWWFEDFGIVNEEMIGLVETGMLFSCLQYHYIYRNVKLHLYKYSTFFLYFFPIYFQLQPLIASSASVNFRLDLTMKLLKLLLLLRG